MQNTDHIISQLLDYGQKNGLISPLDCVYCANRIISLIGANSFMYTEAAPLIDIDEALSFLCDTALLNGVLKENTAAFRDILSADIMNCITPFPSLVNDEFWKRYKEISQNAATDYFYSLSRSTNYIKVQQVKKDIRWKHSSEYGELDITINLSKPEKDPKDIAAAKLAPQSGYPKCLLCAENEGYEGTAAHPARANHRIVPLSLAGEAWFLQYSPYVYYNEHCILLNAKHTPMAVNLALFNKLLDFVQQFPHYFVGSNADLPIVGGSILTHDHFQGGNYEFPMAKSQITTQIVFDEYPKVFGGIINWALSTVRICCKNPKMLASLSDKILTNWRGYSNESCEILAFTTEPHNTITPIARWRNGLYEMDLILRNNRTSEQHPDGIFHPHKEYHYIKKENIGLIEAQGMAILPPRLQTQFGELNEKVKADIGEVFANILQNCAVFKQTQEGQKGFAHFITSCGGKLI